MLCSSCSAPLPKGASFCDECGAKVAASADPMLNRVLGERYLLQKKLGEGGFGAVYEAEEARLKRKVAVKTLHRHLAENREVVRRFRQEGVAASRLEHPNIVKIFDIGDTEDGYLWMAMEFLTGLPLDEHLRQQRALQPDEVMAVMGPVCEALAEAHSKGIIHRDLKPQNIMMVNVGGRLVPKVLDFGISKIVDADQQTASGMAMGTPQYMSPEQWEGASHATAASDVYALGVVLYLMLAGQLPFRADSPKGWMKKHCLEAPEPLAPLLPNAPLAQNLSAVVMRALEKDPAARYKDAAALKQALEQAFTNVGLNAQRGPLSAPAPPAVTAPKPRAETTSCVRCDKDHSRGSADCPASRVGAVVAGKYQIVRLMGAGGMGAVYEAEHLTLHKRVALKMLLPRFAQNQTTNRRFEEEARRAASLKHPGIIEVTDLGRDTDGSAYMEMELLQGSSIADLVSDGPLPVQRALTLFTEALDALSYAHKKGVIHRDLKPDNIFYAKRDDGSFHSKILDFGLAKLLEETEDNLTQTGTMMGTPVYMSPEQATDSKRVDHRSDLYSMGATLYEMLTGKRPLYGQTLNELLTKLIEDRVDRNPRLHRPEVPEWLDALVARTMSKEPSARPQSAEELSTSLRAGGPAQPSSFAETMAAAPAPTAPSQETTARVPSPPTTPTLNARPAPLPKSRAPLAVGAAGVLLALAAVALYPKDTPPSPAPTPATTPAVAPEARCETLQRPDWRPGIGSAASIDGQDPCQRARLFAKEDAIRQALCLSKDDAVTTSIPLTTEACKAALTEPLHALFWRAQIIAEDELTTNTSTTNGIPSCEVRGRFRVMPLPAQRECDLRISSMISKMKSWKKGDRPEEYRFRLSDKGARKTGALYLTSLMPNGVVYSLWDLTGATPVQGNLLDADGKKTPFTQPKYVPLQEGKETSTSVALLLEAGQKNSCEILMAFSLPEEKPFNVEMYSAPGDVVSRIGTIFTQLDSAAGGLDRACWAFQPYEIIP